MHQILLSRYFRGEPKAEGMGEGFVPGRPHKAIPVYSTRSAQDDFGSEMI